MSQQIWKPHFGVLIIFHVVSSICVGSLLVLVYNQDRFFDLDPFKLVLLSLVLTTPVTAISFTALSVWMILRKNQGLKAGNRDTAALSLVAAMVSLVALTVVSAGRYFNWWTTRNESEFWAAIFKSQGYLIASLESKKP